MGQLMIVSNAKNIREHRQIAMDYSVSFELNDFFNPSLLDDSEKLEETIQLYQRYGIPQNSTMHGVFYDIIPFSCDASIREISRNRMRQSMELAKRLGLIGVVFHTNTMPDLGGESYECLVVDGTVEILEELLIKYPDISIYVENMFDRTPDILKKISMKLSKFPNYGICLDWAHANVFGRNLDDWVMELKDYVKHIHINDNDLQSDCHYAVGSGKIDWAYFLECYDSYFSNCSVLIETTEPHMQMESLNYLQRK